VDYYTDAILRALQLIITLDQEVIQVVATSLKISITSTFIASIISMPLAVLIPAISLKQKSLLTLF